MKTWIIVTLAVTALVVVVALTCFGSYVSATNYGVSMEQQLKAAQTDNKNIYAQYGQKVAEVAQVPAMYRDDLVKVVSAAISGRYGENGSQATFQWIKEQNPTIDVSIYKQIQQVIEAGRNNFENGQRRMIDIRRQYETSLGYFWQGMWLRIAGYPKIDLSSFDIVSTEKADFVFSSKKEIEPIKLR